MAKKTFPMPSRKEGADLANYAAFDHFQEIARAGSDEDLALCLTAALHSYLATKALRELANKRRGTP